MAKQTAFYSADASLLCCSCSKCYILTTDIE